MGAFLYLVIAGFLGWLGYAIGKPKGLGALGGVLGFFLCILGVIIIAVIPGQPAPRADQQYR